MIAGIAREVIRRLRDRAEQTPTLPDAALPAEKLITIETLDRYPGASEIIAVDGAIVTPAAREEAIVRGIKIQYGATSNGLCQARSGANARRTNASEAAAPEMLLTPLARRSISLPAGVEVLWTNEPAMEVFRRCGGGQRAAMVSTFSDVERFANELSPNVWVLDRQKLNLVAAVNVAARIARAGSCPQSAPKPQNGGSE